MINCPPVGDGGFKQRNFFCTEYGMMWMNSSQIALSQGQGGNQSLSTEILQMDPSAVQLDNPYYPMAVPPSFETMPEQPMEIEGYNFFFFFFSIFL